MINRAITLMLILTVFAISFAQPAFAQAKQSKQDKQTEKIKEKVRKYEHEKLPWKVKLYNGTSYEGSLSPSTDDSFVVHDKTGGSTTVKYSDVNSIGTQHVSTGLKVGIGAGAAVLVLFIFAIFHHTS